MKKRNNIIALICVCIVWIILFCLIYVCSGCSIKPGTQIEPYPALTVRYGRIESKDNLLWAKPTSDRETTDLTGLYEKDYPDSILLLVPYYKTSAIIGKFMNLGYRINNDTYIISENWYSAWNNKRYMLFIKVGDY